MVDIHKRDHVWLIKWLSSIVMVVTMALTSANMYPLNIYMGLLASFGWSYVSIRWNDRALIILNAVAILVYFIGVLHVYNQ